MYPDSITERVHDDRTLLVGEARPGEVVFGGEDDDLVDAARRSLGEHRPLVIDAEGSRAFECGVEVGDHSCDPLAVAAVGLESGRCQALVARTEGAVAALVLVVERSGHKYRVRVASFVGNSDPPARERIQSQLIQEISMFLCSTAAQATRRPGN